MARKSVREKLAEEQAQWRPGMPKPRRSVRMLFASTVLTLQALAVVFASLAMIGLYRGNPNLPWMIGAGLALAAAFIGACAVLAKPWGIKLGWALQLLAFGLALWIPAMALVALGFTGCWAYALVKGKKIDEENAERDEAERLYREQHGETASEIRTEA